MLSPAARIIAYTVRHNPLYALGQLGAFALMAGVAALVPSFTLFNVQHHIGLDHGSWVDVAAGVVLTLIFLLSAITVVLNNIDRARHYLLPFAEQEQGFIYQLEEFEEKTRESINRQLNYANDYPKSQLTLF